MVPVLGARVSNGQCPGSALTIGRRRATIAV